jgi:hypothetical protein
MRRCCTCFASNTDLASQSQYGSRERFCQDMTTDPIFPHFPQVFPNPLSVHSRASFLCFIFSKWVGTANAIDWLVRSFSFYVSQKGELSIPRRPPICFIKVSMIVHDGSCHVADQLLLCDQNGSIDKTMR